MHARTGYPRRCVARQSRNRPTGDASCVAERARAAGHQHKAMYAAKKYTTMRIRWGVHMKSIFRPPGAMHPAGQRARGTAFFSCQVVRRPPAVFDLGRRKCTESGLGRSVIGGEGRPVAEVRSRVRMPGKTRKVCAGSGSGRYAPWLHSGSLKGRSRYGSSANGRPNSCTQ